MERRGERWRGGINGELGREMEGWEGERLKSEGGSKMGDGEMGGRWKDKRWRDRRPGR